MTKLEQDVVRRRTFDWMSALARSWILFFEFGVEDLAGVL
jgi:hypothetical protein